MHTAEPLATRRGDNQGTLIISFKVFSNSPQIPIAVRPVLESSNGGPTDRVIGGEHLHLSMEDGIYMI